ncbi:MAG: hypothetical protein JW768_03085 [Chitinispirillaceae bacterium]|nr:hypothetical protein [Chitinispirillaceae bacterium]
MYKILILLFAILFFCAKQNDKEPNNRSSDDSQKQSFVLTSKSGNNIGTVFAQMLNDSLFTALFIANKMDTIYKIDGPFFYNANGKDIEVSNDKFYGYTFVLKRNDYFVVRLYGDSGRTVSDNITIEWNDGAKIMEVQKTP